MEIVCSSIWTSSQLRLGIINCKLLAIINYQLIRYLFCRKGSGVLEGDNLKRNKQCYAHVKKAPQAGEKRVSAARHMKQSFRSARR